MKAFLPAILAEFGLGPAEDVGRTLPLPDNAIGAGVDVEATVAHEAGERLAVVGRELYRQAGRRRHRRQDR